MEFRIWVAVFVLVAACRREPSAGTGGVAATPVPVPVSKPEPEPEAVFPRASFEVRLRVARHGEQVGDPVDVLKRRLELLRASGRFQLDAAALTASGGSDIRLRVGLPEGQVCRPEAVASL